MADTVVGGKYSTMGLGVIIPPITERNRGLNNSFPAQKIGKQSQNSTEVYLTPMSVYFLLQHRPHSKAEILEIGQNM